MERYWRQRLWGKDTTELEKEIDKMVYAMYGLTYDEVKVIEPDFSLSEAEYEGIEVEEGKR